MIEKKQTCPLGSLVPNKETDENQSFSPCDDLLRCRAGSYTGAQSRIILNIKAEPLLWKKDFMITIRINYQFEPRY